MRPLAHTHATCQVDTARDERVMFFEKLLDVEHDAVAQQASRTGV